MTNRIDMKTKQISSIIITAFITLVASACSPSGKPSHAEGPEEGHEHGGEIELSEIQMQTVGMRLGGFSSIPMGEGVTANGELRVAPQSIADVTPLIQGLIRKISVSEGQYVSAGTVVATVENIDIGTFISEYADARMRLQLAENELNRQQQLAEQGAGVPKNLDSARIEYESAKSAALAGRERLKMLGINPDSATGTTSRLTVPVTAPISGVVTNIYGRIGSEAGPSQPLMTIVDNKSIYALLKIYEKDLHIVKKGEAVELSLTNGTGLLHGTVEEITRSVDAATKTIDVRVSISPDDRSADLIPGMAINAYINSGVEEVPVLPEEAVVSVEGKDYIYVLDDKENHDGQTMYVFKPFEVVKGNTRNGFVEVKVMEPLPDDAEIVVSKAFYIASMAADHGEHNH